jgi:hypothetical protein
MQQPATPIPRISTHSGPSSQPLSCLRAQARRCLHLECTTLRGTTLLFRCSDTCSAISSLPAPRWHCFCLGPEPRLNTVAPCLNTVACVSTQWRRVSIGPPYQHGYNATPTRPEPGSQHSGSASQHSGAAFRPDRLTRAATTILQRQRFARILRLLGG